MYSPAFSLLTGCTNPAEEALQKRESACPTCRGIRLYGLQPHRPVSDVNTFVPLQREQHRVARNSACRCGVPRSSRIASGALSKSHAQAIGKMMKARHSASSASAVCMRAMVARGMHCASGSESSLRAPPSDGWATQSARASARQEERSVGALSWRSLWGTPSHTLYENEPTAPAEQAHSPHGGSENPSFF